jgi:hypothetical protein
MAAMMNDRPDHEQAAWGLCAACRHLEVVTSAKGSRFVFCGLSRTDPRFRKYPPLPVRACDGYAAEPASERG